MELTREQQRAVETIDHNLQLIACAGSGKTEVITRRIAYILKKKPDNGEKMYELIYLTYIAPEKLSHSELLYRLDISSRHYYRLRQQAFGILSIRLWSAPVAEMDSWLEVLNLLEQLC